MPVLTQFLSRAPRGAWLAGVLALVLPALQVPALADGQERVNVLEENDSLYFNSDKHYTQGLRLSDLAPDLGPQSAWNDPFNLLSAVPWIFDEDGKDTPYSRRYALLLGQSIFTPKNLTLKTPSTHDRPYGGWLYGGASLLQETNRDMLENFELDAGIVGPGALGKQVQNDFHQFIGIHQAKGWADQIQNEPGLMLSYERLWRMPLIGDGSEGVDIVPQAGATAGNVFTYGDIGAQVRIGKNLHAEYGPVRIRPALSGTDYFDADQLDGNLGYYFFAGVQGRAMGHNIFLNGNTFRQSPRVGMKVLVADFQAGFSMFWSSAIRLDLSVVRRTEEFVGQATPDEIGTVAVSFSW
jgi:lipid A 3-O-deacylase